ncbi:MAG: hypothetical protein ABI454_09265 [Sphingomicrobium sp.]
MTKRLLILSMVLVTSCRDQSPPAPTQEQSAQLNDAENMLNEEGPEQRPGPSNSSD